MKKDKKVTATSLLQMKEEGRRICMVTAYDATFARLAERHKVFSRAKEAYELVITHYDPENTQAMNALGDALVRYVERMRGAVNRANSSVMNSGDTMAATPARLAITPCSSSRSSDLSIPAVTATAA